MLDNTSNPAKIAEQIGRERYNTFVEDRYIMQVLLCMTTYRKTICLRSVRKTLIVSSKSKQQLVSTKSD